jgi:molybdate transport system substrate-binding protein
VTTSPRRSSGLRSRAAIVVACVVAASSLAACAGCGSDGTQAPVLKGAVTVFASDALRGPFTRIARRFEAVNAGVTVRLVLGSSSALLARTRPGRIGGRAGADVFASSSAAALHGLTGNDELHGNDEVTGNPTNAIVFVTDVLEIVTAPGNPKRIATLADLAKPSLRVALPGRGDKSGVAARQALRLANVRVRHAVRAGSAAAAVRAVTTGRADATIVYRTAVGGTGLAAVAIPAAQRVEADYVAAQPIDASHRALGEAFVRFLFTKDGQDALTSQGFTPIACSKPVTEGGCGPDPPAGRVGG